MAQVQYDDALHLMESIGGSFVKSLAACYYVADSTNRAKLREAFGNYFAQYERQFQQISASANAEGVQQ